MSLVFYFHLFSINAYQEEHTLFLCSASSLLYEIGNRRFESVKFVFLSNLKFLKGGEKTA